MLLIIITAIIVVKIVQKSKNKNVSTKIENKIEENIEKPKEETNDISNSSFEIYNKDNAYFVKIKLDEDNSGIFQSVYKQRDNKYIICETVQDDYSKGEMKEVELSCYNLNTDENLEDLEKIQETFIQE